MKLIEEEKDIIISALSAKRNTIETGNPLLSHIDAELKGVSLDGYYHNLSAKNKKLISKIQELIHKISTSPSD